MALKGVSLATVNCMMLDIVTMSCQITSFSMPTQST